MDLETDEAPEFLGVHRHSMDTKGRLVLPAPHRELLEGGLVMTIGFDNCLTVHPMEEWSRVRAALRELKTTDPVQRRFARMITSQAEHTQLDKQGRITIPQRLREYAHLTRDCAVVGAETRAEIWDSARWQEYEQGGLAGLAETSTTFDIGIF